MTTAEYIRQLLKRSDAIDQVELARTIGVARFALDKSDVRTVIISDMLERVHTSWRTLEGWLNTYIEREESPHLLEWINIDDSVDRIGHLSARPSRTDGEDLELVQRVWDMVVTLSDAKCIERLLSDAERQYHGFVAWQFMSVRQACKNALVMMEFDPQFDSATQKR